jgi:hypothetical protein
MEYAGTYLHMQKTVLLINTHNRQKITAVRVFAHSSNKDVASGTKVSFRVDQKSEASF